MNCLIEQWPKRKQMRGVKTYSFNDRGAFLKGFLAFRGDDDSV